MLSEKTEAQDIPASRADSVTLRSNSPAQSLEEKPEEPEKVVAAASLQDESKLVGGYKLFSSV